MVLPFTHRDAPTTHGVVSTVLHNLDLLNADPVGAEAAIYSRFAAAGSVHEVTRADVQAIAADFGLEDADVHGIGERVLQDALVHALDDDELTNAERAALKHIVEVFALPGALANRAVREVGRRIYRRALLEAAADGEITEDEHLRLMTLKLVLGLSTRVPDVGVNWRLKFRYEWEPLHRALFHLHERAAKAMAVLEDVARVRPDILDHTNLSFDIEEMRSVQVESDELIDDIGSVLDHEDESEASYGLVVEAKELVHHYDTAFWARFDLVLAQYRERSKGPLLDPGNRWRSNAIQRQRENTSIAATNGFRPDGDRKQVARATDIIAERVVGSPTYLRLVALATGDEEDPEASLARHFLGWLRHRNAWWWMKVGQQSDLEYLFTEWRHHRVW